MLKEMEKRESRVPADERADVSEPWDALGLRRSLKGRDWDQASGAHRDREAGSLLAKSLRHVDLERRALRADQRAIETLSLGLRDGSDVQAILRSIREGFE